MVYGVLQDSETGFPKELRGLDVQNIDQEILRLDSMIRGGINPRIPTVRIQCISLSNSTPVVIVRVQKSSISPHR